jgi:acetoin utilization deacetylase AcuC-like enzyme
MGLYVHHRSSYEHDTGVHPENARRLTAIEGVLEGAGWPGLERVEAPAATREQLERVHTAEHVDSLRVFVARGGGAIDVDTLTSPGSYEAALHAAGGAAWAAEQLLADGGGFALAALRPPGHHAERARAMGFCLFNNAAVAAAHAVAECSAERVLVLDWDVHHGNGTEEIFASSTEVLYVSIHQSPLYPGTGPAGYEGEAGAEGFTVNLPVAPGAGNEEFLALVQHLVVPLTRAFRPGLVILSAGFDAHRDDPLANCEVDETGYAGMAASMRDLARELGIPVLACLEGGYDLGALSRSVLATVRALAGAEPPPEVAPATAELHLERVRRRWAL